MGHNGGPPLEPPPLLTLLDVYAHLRKACAAAGSLTKWSTSHGLSPSYVSDVMNARRDPGPTILSALGLRAVKRYQQVKERQHG